MAKGGHAWQRGGMRGEEGVQGEGVCAWQGGGYMVKGMCGRGCAWQGVYGKGACMVRGTYVVKGAYVVGACVMKGCAW